MVSDSARANKVCRVQKLILLIHCRRNPKHNSRYVSPRCRAKGGRGVFQKGIVLYCARRECVNTDSVSALLSAKWSFVDFIQLQRDKNYAYDVLDSVYPRNRNNTPTCSYKCTVHSDSFLAEN